MYKIFVLLSPKTIKLSYLKEQKSITVLMQWSNDQLLSLYLVCMNLIGAILSILSSFLRISIDFPEMYLFKIVHKMSSGTQNNKPLF